MIIFSNKLLSLLSKHDKKFLILLLLFSIFISMIETVGIAAIMPFISVASDFSIIHSNEYYKYIFNFFNFDSDILFVLFFGTILIGFYFFRSMINLFYFYMLSRFSNGRYHTLAYRLLENYLGRSYRNFTDENSSNLNKTIINEVNYLTSILSSLLLIISELFIILFIYAMMLYVDWKITIFLSIILIINTLILIKTVSSKIKIAGSKREYYQKIFYEVLNSTFANFKLIKLKSEDQKVLKKFTLASSEFTKANIANGTLTHVPRLFLEALGFIIVILIIIYLIYTNKSDISSSMAIISMFILGLYRLMPSANRILTGYNQILFNYRALDIVHNDIIYEIEDLGNNKIEFNHDIKLNTLSFAYIKDKDVLKDINITIKKGSKISFIGESGSGKSTLVDVIMGLYRPKNGEICIDNILLDDNNIKNWRKNIGYIPQSIYLFDGSVAQNVAFNETYDEIKVKNVLKKAKLLDFLESHHNGIETSVGENGLKLSGGQKQRVAIARALYNNPNILILDEATSALDDETESEIMNEIYDISKDKTLIIIAHRLTTLTGCDKIYKLENGEIKNVQ